MMAAPNNFKINTNGHLYCLRCNTDKDFLILSKGEDGKIFYAEHKCNAIYFPKEGKF